VRGDEKRVVDSFCAWLEHDGWEVSREAAFVDVVARKGRRTLYAEAKGRTAAIGLDIDTMYGQILRRMPFDEDPAALFAVVVPEEAARAALRVKKRVRDVLRIQIYAIGRDGSVRLVRD
jgi:hypothetical protein